MPGTVVGIARKGPAVSVLGLGSQLSSWLTPPCMKMFKMRFCLALTWSAIVGVAAIAPAMPAVAVTPRNERRERKWSGEWQAEGQGPGGDIVIMLFALGIYW